MARGRGRVERKLDPGRYAVRIISSSGTRLATVELEPTIEQRVVLAAPQAGLLKSPWFWTAAGVAAAGLVLAGFFLTRNRVQEPVVDPVFGVVTTSYGR